MKIAVLSDIHGQSNALKSVIEDMSKFQVDEVIILGDVVIKGPEPQEVYDLLVNLNPSIWIKGNTEDFFNQIDDDFVPESEIEKRLYSEFLYTLENLSIDAINHLKSLPEEAYMDVEQTRLLCVHGSDQQIHDQVGIMMPEIELKAMFQRVDADLILCGHTHWPYLASFDGKTVINPGSIGLPKDDLGASYVILEVENGLIQHSFRRVRIEPANNS